MQSQWELTSTASCSSFSCCCQYFCNSIDNLISFYIYHSYAGFASGLVSFGIPCVSEAMGIVHSKVLGGANLYGSGRGILDVGKGAYRYADAGLAEPGLLALFISSSIT